MLPLDWRRTGKGLWCRPSLLGSSPAVQGGQTKTTLRRFVQALLEEPWECGEYERVESVRVWRVWECGECESVGLCIVLECESVESVKVWRVWECERVESLRVLKCVDCESEGQTVEKLQELSGKICPREVPREIRLSRGAQPQGKAWLPKGPPVGKFPDNS